MSVSATCIHISLQKVHDGDSTLHNFSNHIEDEYISSSSIIVFGYAVKNMLDVRIYTY